jgi:hypothetical protein
MRFNTKELMVIRGGSIASPEFTPQAEGVATALLRFTREAHGQPKESSRAEVLRFDGTSAEWTVSASFGDEMVLQAAWRASPSQPEGAGAAMSLETWVPLWRSTDSLRLLGESGVLQVGVNDLGWVVYDWIPGP